MEIAAMLHRQTTLMLTSIVQMTLSICYNNILHFHFYIIVIIIYQICLSDSLTIFLYLPMYPSPHLSLSLSYTHTHTHTHTGRLADTDKQTDRPPRTHIHTDAQTDGQTHAPHTYTHTSRPSVNCLHKIEESFHIPLMVAPYRAVQC